MSFKFSSHDLNVEHWESVNNVSHMQVLSEKQIPLLLQSFSQYYFFDVQNFLGEGHNKFSPLS